MERPDRVVLERDYELSRSIDKSGFAIYGYSCSAIAELGYIVELWLNHKLEVLIDKSPLAVRTRHRHQPRGEIGALGSHTREYQPAAAIDPACSVRRAVFSPDKDTCDVLVKWPAPGPDV